MGERKPIRTNANETVEFDWCQRASGEWDGKFVVRRTVRSDYAAFATQGEAQAFIREMEQLTKLKTRSHE